MLKLPAIQNPAYPLGSKLEDNTITSKMENGIVVSRARFARLRETFVLKWPALSANEYFALKTFWKAVNGGSQEFTWQYPIIPNDPLSGKEYTVRFSGEFSFELIAPGIYAGSLVLQEV